MSGEFYSYDWLLDRAYSKIPQVVDTSGERFEIPKIRAEIIGNRTYITNFSEIAKKLNRDPTHLLKFFSKELATFGQLEDTKASFVGQFSRLLLQKKLEKYVKTYVICNQCGKPDTKLIKEGRLVFLKCLACGAEYVVPKL